MHIPFDSWTVLRAFVCLLVRSAEWKLPSCGEQRQFRQAVLMKLKSAVERSEVDLPKFANRCGLLASTVGAGNLLSISLMSLRISAMSPLNNTRSESTLPFHCPNAKIAPAATDSSDKKTIQNSGLVNHSFTIRIHVSLGYPLIPPPWRPEIRRNAS